jgi:hypothetical protein
MQTKPTPHETTCTCKQRPDLRVLDRTCPIHGDEAEAARRQRAERMHEQRRASA